MTQINLRVLFRFMMAALLVMGFSIQGHAKKKKKSFKAKGEITSVAKVKLKRKPASMQVPAGVPTELPEKMIMPSGPLPN